MLLAVAPLAVSCRRMWGVLPLVVAHRLQQSKGKLGGYLQCWEVVVAVRLRRVEPRGQPLPPEGQQSLVSALLPLCSCR